MLDALGFSWEVPAAPRGRARSKPTTAMAVAAPGGGVSSAMTDRAEDNGAAAPSPANAVSKRRYTRKTKPDGMHSPSETQGSPQPNDQMTHLPEAPAPFEDMGNEEDVDEEMLKLLDPEIQKEVRLMRFSSGAVIVLHCYPWGCAGRATVGLWSAGCRTRRTPIS
jgi:hypothetical protein